jgi:hypothetical protein
MITLAVLVLAGCGAAPLVIDREAQQAVMTSPGWNQKWKDSALIEETRTVMSREVQVRALNHIGLWNLKKNAAIAVVSTPQLAVFGIDANPAATLTDEQLVNFILDTARSQADEVLGIQLPQTLSLHKERDESVETSFGLLTGSQFRVEVEGVSVTLLILRAKSGSDHLVVLGLVPNSLDQDSFDAVISAVKTIKHPE